MMLLDYLICNQDRHFGNFGAIRDAVTLEWVGFAPIFDSGTSLWFDQYASKIKALADAPAKPFAATQQAQLALAKDGLQTLNLSALNGCKDEVLAIFEQAHLDVCWTISNSGAVTLALHAERNTVFPELPRFGLRLFLPKEMARVSYFGMGPMESYCDKHHAASHGYFSSTIWQQHEDYIRPQENGSHYDCDYVQLDGAGIKLTAVGAKPFCFNASHYTQEELTEKAHNYELHPCDSTVLCLDYAQNGIGSASCGPRLAEQYRLNNASFDFSIRLIPEKA